MINNVELVEDGVVVTVASGTATFTWHWLRDHGEDPASLDSATLQRKVDTFAIPADLTGSPQLSTDAMQLEIAWSDGSTPTVCSAALFHRVLGSNGDSGARAWSSPTEIPEFSSLPFEAVLSEDAAVSQWLERVNSAGFALVSGMPPTAAAAKQLAERIAVPRSTLFGGMWRLAAEMDDHQDSAYSAESIEPHTDSTYFTDAPGLQMFCCEERTGTGGESVLVDGLAIAEELRAASPPAFEVLITTEVPGRYVEPGVLHEAARPPIRLADSGRFEQISFNNYDRAPFWLPEPQMRAFYKAYAELHRLINERHRWFEVRLEPGEALLFDNWRMLHARNAYTGRRVFHGCYHNRDDYLSRLATLRNSKREVRN